MRELLFRLLMKYLTPDDIEWVVNDDAELGVKIGNRFFFLYKGNSLEYKEDDTRDGDLPMLWRHHYKREFGEVCHPDSYWLLKQNKEMSWVPSSAMFQDRDPNWADNWPGDGWKKIKS